MKKVFMLLFVLMSLTAFAQSKTTRIQETQARLLDVTTNAYVKPLTVELKVISGRTVDSWKLSKEQVENDFRGNVANIRSWAVYMASRKHDCDLMVAATFNFRSLDNGDGYEIEIVGFPAIFQNWATITENDMYWINLENSSRKTENDKTKSINKH